MSLLGTFIESCDCWYIFMDRPTALFSFKNMHTYTAELAKSIGIGIGFLVALEVVLVLLRGFPKYWHWYC